MAERYLTSIRLPQQKHIYALGKEALPILVAQGIAPDDVLNERLRIHELKELFLKHEMMIVDFHVMLLLAGKTDALKLVGWQEGRELYDSVAVADQSGTGKLPRASGCVSSRWKIPAGPQTPTELTSFWKPIGQRQTRLASRINSAPIGTIWSRVSTRKSTELRIFRVLTLTLNGSTREESLPIGGVRTSRSVPESIISSRLSNTFRLQTPRRYYRVCITRRETAKPEHPIRLWRRRVCHS